MSGFVTVVFCGPTVSHAAVREIVDGAICRPPAAMGDVYRCLDEDPHCIAIIDGYFEGVLSVWHKEILYAMSRGVHVLGASSMGALRAAELADFGMRGVGRIYQQFRRGELEDDDEVAVLHGPGELGFAAVSEAMVNIRETLSAAAAQGVLGAADSETLAAIAKGCFYHDRNWRHLLSLAAADLEQRALDRLREWLPDGAVDQKRLDALALLQEIGQLQASPPPRFEAGFRFEWSEMWQNAISRHFTGAREVAGIDARVLDELRLDPRGYGDAVVQAGFHLLASGETAPAAHAVDDVELRQVFNEFRERNGLFDRKSLDDWLAANALDETGFERLMDTLARREKLVAGFGGRVEAAILDWLKLGGRYAGLRRRARDKQDRLEDSLRRLADEQKPGLLRWYFDERLRVPAPPQLDAWLLRAGFADRDHLYRALFDEWVYCDIESRRQEQDL